jgi:hypothetical protein
VQDRLDFARKAGARRECEPEPSSSRGPSAADSNLVPAYLRPRDKPPTNDPRAGVYLTGQCTPLLELDNLEELRGLKLDDPTKNDFTLDKRVHYMPAAKLLATIRPSNDELVLRPVDLVGSLRKSGAPYLFIASQPPRTAFRRQKYQFQLDVQSSRTGFKYTLNSGPAGMEISPGGAVSWEVPADFDEDDPDVIITVTNAAGREVMVSYKLRVR